MSELDQSELIQTDINAYLAMHENKELLRFLTCGNVDDGKSTLIGRLLHDSKAIYEDQLSAVRADSVKSGTTGLGQIDLALLVDGLQAEREQGITIDVAYRYFSTSVRKFIIADTPGHEQYTRNMATGASSCDLAVILIDARYGVQTQTKRHSFIVSLLGIKHVIVAINKMDLMGYDESTFNNIQQDYLNFAKNLNFGDVHFVPISALNGDNVVNPSAFMPWYTGMSLIKALNTIPIASDHNFTDARFPVQYVNRPNLDFRGFSGTVAAGIFHQGDSITVLPSGKSSNIKSIITYDGELHKAYAPMAVTLTLEDEIDVSRGDILVGKQKHKPIIADKFIATVVWMTEQPLIPGRQYLFKLATRILSGTIPSIHHRIDVNTLAHHDCTQLHLNEIGSCSISLIAPVVFDPYTRSKATGSFIIIDRLSNVTVGAGMITGSSIPSSQAARVTTQERSARYNQIPVAINITGSYSGELAYELERKLFDNGNAVTVQAEFSTESVYYYNHAGLISIHINAPIDFTELTFNDQMSVEEVFLILKNDRIVF
jgi:sulfate adenylyltransferase large subunit